MTTIIGWLRQQSTHTGLALLAIMVLLAHTAGVDLAVLTEGLARGVAEVAALAGAVSALAKVVLPDTPPQPLDQAAEKLRQVAAEMRAER